MPNVKPFVMAKVECFQTPPGNREENACNTPTSDRDHESPMTSSQGKKSRWRGARETLKSIKNKFGGKDPNNSPSSGGRIHSRKPIPEFSSVTLQEDCSIKIHYEHSASHERPGTASPAKRSEHSSQKPSRRNSMGSIRDKFGSIKYRLGSRHSIRRSMMVDSTRDLSTSFLPKPDVCVVNKSGEDVNYGSEGFTYYSSVKKDPKLIIDCPVSEPDAFEGSQPLEEVREAKTPDSYLELLIRGSESPYVESGDYDDLFATPCRSNSRHVHYTDFESPTAAAKQSSTDQKNTNELSTEAGKASLCAAFGDFGLEFHRRIEDREERYHTLKVQPDSVSAIQKRFLEYREHDAASETDRGHLNEEVTREVIEKVVAKMKKNRHSSSLTVSDRGSSDAVGNHPPPSLSCEKDSFEIKEVMKRDTAIKEEVIKEEVATTKNLEKIERFERFLLRILEDSIELRTPSEIPSYLPTKPLPYRMRLPMYQGKVKTGRAQTRTRTVKNTRQVSTTFVEFPEVEDEPMQLRRYNTQSDAMAALDESFQTCDYSDYLIWEPKLRLYKVVPHDAPIPDAEELKKYGCSLVRVPMDGEVCNRASMLGDLRPFHTYRRTLANDDRLPLKAESLSLEPYESSYDAETAFMKMPLRRPEKQSSSLYLKANSKIAEETKDIEPKVSDDWFDHEINSIGERFAGNDFAEEAESSGFEDYIFEHEIDSSTGRSFLRSDYSASSRLMNPERFRLYREVMGSDIYDPSGPEEVPPSKTWFDLGKEYKARHPVEEHVDHSEDIPAVGECHSDANCDEGNLVKVCSEISTTTSDKIIEELDLQEIIWNATDILRSSSTCSEPTFRHVENIAREEKRPVVVVTEIIPSEGEPSRDGTPTVGLSLERVNDACTSQLIQTLKLTSMRKHKKNKMRKHLRKLHFESDDSKDVEADGLEDDSSNVDDTDQSDFSITEFSPGFKFSEFGSVLKDTEDALTPTKESRGTKSLRPRLPHIGLGSPPWNKAVTSFGSTKGKLPLRPEYTPIFDDLEPFDKAESLMFPLRTITPDDLNIRMVGKAARHSQLAKPEGKKVGALVDVFQAHGLMPKRLRPELIRVPSPANPPRQPSGRPPTPIPGTPSKNKFRQPHAADYEAPNGPQCSTRVAERAASPTSRPESFGSHSDAETEICSVFGVELERVEARLQHKGEERAYRDSELYG